MVIVVVMMTVAVMDDLLRNPGSKPWFCDCKELVLFFCKASYSEKEELFCFNIPLAMSCIRKGAAIALTVTCLTNDEHIDHMCALTLLKQS